MQADQQVKAYIDRILRLKEEQDAISDDIREVYAEAKGGGYDKTAMGEVVTYLRKIEKKGRDAVAERGAMFDLYLDAYERPSRTHAREGQKSVGSSSDLREPAARSSDASAATHSHSQVTPLPADMDETDPLPSPPVSSTPFCASSHGEA